MMFAALFHYAGIENSANIDFHEKHREGKTSWRDMSGEGNVLHPYV